MTPAGTCSQAASVMPSTRPPRTMAAIRASSGGAKNHQCGCRSRTMSSLSLSSFLGNGTAAAYPCPAGRTGHAGRPDATSAPAQLGEASVVDAEVVGDLVHDRDRHLLHHLRLRGAQGADRQAEDREAIRHRQAAGAVPSVPPGEGHPLVAAEQPTVTP